MITECNTQEEYKEKISELRKERDLLRDRANAIDREMDRLEINSKIVDFVVGNYIIIDNTSKGGYKTYFHVDTWKNEPRGVRLYGKGFSVGNKYSIHLDESYTLSWEHFIQPIEITEEEFFNVFDEEVKKIRKGLEEFKTYKEFPDMYKLKADLNEGRTKVVWKDEEETLIGKAVK